MKIYMDRRGFLIVVVILFTLAFLVGCKDEAETSDEPTIYMEYSDILYEDEPEPNVSFFISREVREVWLSIEIKDEPNFADCDNIIYLYEGDDYDILIVKKEPNEPAANWVEAVKRWPDAQGYITDNFGKTLPLSTFEEPNEPEEEKPECKHERIEKNEFIEFTCVCGKYYNTWDIVMKNIPIWPEYIELEKDLILDFPKSEDYPIVQRPPLTIIKGTKIYFKED